jgi:hypothetical protein
MVGRSPVLSRKMPRQRSSCMDHRREQTRLDGDVLSPEMLKAKELLEGLRAGKIIVRRIP